MAKAATRTPSPILAADKTAALAITTPLGVVIHTGDFKVDPTPTDNILFDLHTLADYGRRGVLLLLSDSTNVDRPGYSESERAVRPRLEDIYNRAERRLVDRHRHEQVQVVAVAGEERVRLDADGDVDIARRTAEPAGIAPAGHPQARAVGDARRHGHGHRDTLGHRRRL